MNTITLLQPGRIVFGNGCADQCAELLKQRGITRVLVVTSASVLPHLAQLQASLRDAGCAVVGTETVGPEPGRAMFEEMLARVRREKFEGVLGVGGGSAMDVAKLIAALAQGRQSVAEIFGVNRLEGRAKFLICLPTTAGSGSEVSPNAVLLDEAEQLKKGVVSPHLVPDIALIDPLLSLSVPASVTAATGVDALTHCIEGFANKAAHPMVDVYALEGVRLIGANLERAVREGGDLEARGKMALGSLYGGLCLGPVNTAAVHALSYPLGGQFHIAHGVSNAVLLPHVLRFNLPQAPERYASVARALGVEPAGSATATAERGVERLVELSRACGVPQTLAELGVPREAIPGMAKAAMQVTRLLKNNLRTVTEEDAIRIYEATY
jgi:alcohol dehydrogenase